MPRLVALLLLLLLAPVLPPRCAPAAEPVAILIGPGTAATDAEFLFRFTGTVTDSDVDLLLAIGPEPVAPAVHFTKDGRPSVGTARVGKPGSYLFVLVASGIPPGKEKTTFAFATALVVVTAPAPPPPPEPPPGPTPDPAPAPYAGKLWAVFVLPDAPSVELAALRDDPAVRSELAARQVEYRAYAQSQAEVAGAPWQANITRAGGAPVVLWIDATRAVVRATKVMTADGIVSDARKVRGK